MLRSSLPIGATAPALVNAVIEIPKGSRNKYEYVPELNTIKLDRVIPSSVMYPTDYGFIPETLAPDGDQLDILIFISQPTFPGCLVVGRPIALAKMADEKGPDSKIVAVAADDPHYASIQSLNDIDEAYRQEIQHFFEVYKELEHKPVNFMGWGLVDEAYALISATHQAYLSKINP